MRDDDWSDDADDDEYADDAFDEDDTTDTRACPQCGAEVYEDAVECPVCGSYITFSTHAWSGRPGWWIALGIAGIIALILVLVGSRGW
ncbi:MAG: zinc-ribbon domain-containing protein [Pirellulales bacterium]